MGVFQLLLHLVNRALITSHVSNLCTHLLYETLNWVAPTKCLLVEILRNIPHIQTRRQLIMPIGMCGIQYYQHSITTRNDSPLNQLFCIKRILNMPFQWSYYYNKKYLEARRDQRPSHQLLHIPSELISHAIIIYGTICTQNLVFELLCHINASIIIL